jgi:hypothetical protein
MRLTFVEQEHLDREAQVIVLGDDADEPVIVTKNRQAAELVIEQRAAGHRRERVMVDGPNVALHDLVDADVCVARTTLFDGEACKLGRLCRKQIAVRDEAEQKAFLVNDWQVTYVLQAHHVIGER